MPTEEPLPPNVIPFPSHRRQPQQPSLPGVTSREGHHQREVTVLQAELRDWPSVSESLGHERARIAMSKAIDAALAALGDHGAESLTLDGEPTQPTIWCEFEGEDAPARAVRGAVAARSAIAESQSVADEDRFRVAIGIDTGEILHVRADESLSYQAVGAMRTVAARLRDFAGPGQIFLTRAVLDGAGGIAEAQPLGDVRINVHGETKEAFSLVELHD